MSALLDATNATPQALVGTRIRDDNDFRGTIRYVGPVATSTKDPNATWYGVEWDDATRGKHDGAVEKDSQEIRYFTCPAGAGSFVKPKKVDRGSSLVEALRQKYVGLDAPVEAPLGVDKNEADSRDFLKGSTEQTKRNGEEITRGTFEHKAYTKRGNTKAIQFCGELNVRKEQQLDDGVVDRVVLRCAGVSRLGSLDQASTEHLASLTILDLQCNLLAAWTDVGDIVKACPNLTSLDVSGNRLQLTSSEDLAPLRNLKSLAANGVGLKSWEEILSIGRAAPSLEVLHVGKNAGCCSGKCEVKDAFPSLRLLDVACTDLRDATPFAALPKLDELHAAENPLLANITGCVFSKLTALGCAGCGFAAWSDVDALALSCPQLTRLRFGRDNAVTSALGASEARALLVARLATVRLLNGAEVSRRERTEAEKRYIRIAKAKIEQGGSEQDHPRLKALIEEHGEPMSKLASSNQGGPLGANLVTLTLRCMCAEQCTKEPVRKKFPGSTKISMLKRISTRVFGVDAAEITLYFVPEEGCAPTYLDDDDAQLSYFGVPDGATVDVADKVAFDE
ncbi:unnamed protein product [Pelagomonas calceolata]|uniref:CAP-Gly domain-containing protein n=1 Tax=Pelagomonas calceolata TaxID=35677 RepID=A0A7S3ZSI4_9STRA|nr:unnamed protein product [Pelagomonas calceolata]|mmetsp:Transcript_19818/g.56303  ORF Transcript_19818/g.56303 Transcript_19818/m.56303 type:complete len:565 (-) Transcript_19818:26-1720(-)